MTSRRASESHVSTARYVLAAVVVLIALTWRLVRQDLGAPANLELVTAASLTAMVLVRHRLMALVPLLIAIVSDLLLANTAILVFTWSAWAVIGIGALSARRSRPGWRRYAWATGYGIGASLWFYAWTNFGVWLLGRGLWYPSGIDGLIASYTAGLPFLRPMLVGNLVFLPLAVGAVALLERWEAAGRQPSAPVLSDREVRGLRMMEDERVGGLFGMKL